MNQLHPIMQAALAPFMPIYPMTYCSQCGCETGPGDHGFSSCKDHQARDQARWLAADLANNINKINQHYAAALRDQINTQHKTGELK